MPSDDKGEKNDDRAGEFNTLPRDVPDIDFTTFVLSLSTSALVHLGDAAMPEGEERPAELGLARQTIDLIALIEEKTTGNLTGEEERLLSQVLYDLRMRYLAKTRETG